MLVFKGKYIIIFAQKPVMGQDGRTSKETIFFAPQLFVAKLFPEAEVSPAPS